MTGAELIAQERQRQIEEEGYSSDHDDKEINGELSLAAACYAVEGVEDVRDIYAVIKVGSGDIVSHEDAFPWEPDLDKREVHTRLRRLVIAGALIAAEIDRLQRLGERA